MEAEMKVRNIYGTIYERLVKRCPPFSFHPPWSFLSSGADCYGPICDPTQTVAVLREEFSEHLLARAGVLVCTPAGQFSLRPEFINPMGAIIAFRDHPQHTPFLLLTARGCWPRSHFPITAACKDCWTEKKVIQKRVLFASPRIAEVVLLRALGFPATLATGIPSLSPDGLRILDMQFGGQDPPPAR
jgi:hypothetical protein